MTPQAWTAALVEETILQIVKEELRLGTDFVATTPLETIGLDSLALVRILAAIDQSMGIWIGGDVLTPENLADVRTLSACVVQSMPQ